ncbi:MAG TPA: hypothetical protein VIJ00_09865, partial [Nakamurella sp.]
AGEAAHAAVTGQRIGPATLRVRVVILSDELGRPLTTEDRLTSSIELISRSAVVSGRPSSSDRMTTRTRRVAGPMRCPVTAACAASPTRATPLDTSRVAAPTARVIALVTPRRAPAA